MSKYVFYSLISALLIVGAFAVKSCREVKTLRNENDIYERNERTWIDKAEHYRVQDSLSAAKVGELQLSLDDAKKVMAEDMKTIENLKTKLKNVEQIEKVVTNTQIKVIERLKDTTIMKHDTMMDVRVIEVEKPHYEVKAMIVRDTIEMDITTHDSLLITETVEYKRFLGFLWKTHRIKNRTFDVVSKNPNTIIEDVKVVTIKK